MSSGPSTLHLHQKDNVAVALSAIPAGQNLPGLGLAAAQDIPAGHKLALAPIAQGQAVIKYGQIMGFASKDIAPGAHVHTHNVTSHDLTRDYSFGQDARPVQLLPEDQRATFQGYVRPDGRVGTRNYLGVLATVNCSASLVNFIAAALSKEELAGYPNVDGVVPLGHGWGCGMPGKGEGMDILQRCLAGYARSPNFAGVLLVGLGCEGNNLDSLLPATGLAPGPNLRTINIQETGGTRATIEAGLKALREMLPAANQCQRQPVWADRLLLGLECGGSDAFSGLTANPTMGAAVDILVRQGGTAILSETPEIYGAEHLLTRRAADEAVGRKLVERIRWWEAYTRNLGGELEMNPSPGNKAGGLTTIWEKSLGAVSKAGTSDLREVYRYAEPVKASGLVFMDTPGYDVVSITGMVAGGANLVCFTTGRGSVLGAAPVPVIKIATNSAMHRHMAEDMDLNAGEILEGKASVAQMGARLFDLILAVASGQRSKSEAWPFGSQEFVPWHMGPVI